TVSACSQAPRIARRSARSSRRSRPPGGSTSATRFACASRCGRRSPPGSGPPGTSPAPPRNRDSCQPIRHRCARAWSRCIAGRRINSIPHFAGSSITRPAAAAVFRRSRDGARTARSHSLRSWEGRLMKLAFYFTLTCTARCDHCITIAGPKVRRKMTLEDARAVVQSVARVPQLDGIVFTGGENFIHRDELLELVRDCTALGLKSEVITNAFWATSLSAAREALVPFREAGLGLVRISVDRFHLPYVATDRVHTALAALEAEGFQRFVTCVVEQPNAVYKKSILRDVLDD